MSDEQTPQEQTEEPTNPAPEANAEAQQPQDAAEQSPPAAESAAVDGAQPDAEQAATSDEAAAEATKETAAEQPAAQGDTPANGVEAAMQAMLEGADESAGEALASAEDVEAAMQAMLEGADGGQGSGGQLPPGAQPFEPPDLSAESGGGESSQIDMLDDVELDVKIELGRTEMYIEDVLGLGPGSVVELDKAAGDPVDIYVNERLVARGEVLVLNDSFCVRINDIVSPVPELEEER